MHLDKRACCPDFSLFLRCRCLCCLTAPFLSRVDGLVCLKRAKWYHSYAVQTCRQETHPVPSGTGIYTHLRLVGSHLIVMKAPRQKDSIRHFGKLFETCPLCCTAVSSELKHSPEGLKEVIVTKEAHGSYKIHKALLQVYKGHKKLLESSSPSS